MNITLRVDKSLLCLPNLKSITVLVYDFSFKNEIRIIDGLGLRGDRGKMIHGAK